MPRVNPADVSTIPKFVDPLPKPPIAKPTAHNKYPHNSYYEFVIRQAKHRFHKYFPLTTIWGYNGITPGPTFEAKKDKKIYVKYINRLPKKHILPVDNTLHGTFDSPEVRSVVHLHGANVAWESDGHPEAWYTQNYEKTGPKFTKKVHEYTNNQPGTTLWYHDHTMGSTRLNVYSGLAGFYLLRDPLEERLNLPKGKYEIPLLIQDRSFNEDGSLAYPEPPIQPFFFGETIAVNGKIWPYLNVEPRKYRFRIHNGSNFATYIVRLSNGATMTQIGTDGGLLNNPVPIPSVTLMPAERIDVIIDFSNFEGEKIVLKNDDVATPDDPISDILQFNVCLPLSGRDTSVIPDTLSHNMDLHPETASNERFLPLTQDAETGMFLLGNRMYHEPVTEKPALDSIEIWNFVNETPFDHPIHVHLIQFKILGRYFFERDIDDHIVQIGDLQQPEIYETGWKDTVRCPPGMVTKVIMHWKEHTGHYIWHCHLLEHEDHDMMRPIRVIDEMHDVKSPPPPHHG